MNEFPSTYVDMRELGRHPTPSNQAFAILPPDRRNEATHGKCSRTAFGDDNPLRSIDAKHFHPRRKEIARSLLYRLPHHKKLDTHRLATSAQPRRGVPATILRGKQSGARFASPANSPSPVLLHRTSGDFRARQVSGARKAVARSASSTMRCHGCHDRQGAASTASGVGAREYGTGVDWPATSPAEGVPDRQRRMLQTGIASIRRIAAEAGVASAQPIDGTARRAGRRAKPPRAIASSSNNPSPARSSRLRRAARAASRRR